MINSGLRMNMHNKRRMYVYTMKNFDLVAFRVVCTGSQVGMTENKNYQYLYNSMNRSANCATTAIGN